MWHLGDLSLRQVFAAAFAWRVCNVMLIRTAFSPDEYWQSIEVAHRLVFGCARQAYSCSKLGRMHGIARNHP